ncbi:MAG: hypothetical protein ACHQ49_08510 [Elusimicrobiota bacterium]
MLTKTSRAIKLVGALLAFVVALPLGSWAAARAPIAVQVSFGSGGGKSIPAFCVHRRARRERRDSSAYHGNWSRALTASVSFSQELHAFRPHGRPFPPPVVDLPPPDLPPA